MSYCLLGPLFELVIAKTSISEVGGGASMMQQLQVCVWLGESTTKCGPQTNMGPHILHIQKLLPLSDRRERFVEVFILYPVCLKSKIFDIHIDVV